MNRKKVLMLSFMLIMAMLLLSGCVPGDGSSSLDDPAGFFSGVWHGWIAPFSLTWKSTPMWPARPQELERSRLVPSIAPSVLVLKKVV